jgi:hypothetical protein
MKPLLLFCLLALAHTVFAQSLDYISIRKNNGRSLKNFYTGSTILFQTVDGSYLHGPIKAIRNDSVYITIYDVRYYPTIFGTTIKDTIAVYDAGVHCKEIKRIQINRRQSFLQRRAGPLLMLGGGGYFATNILNGAFFNQPVTGKDNLRRASTAAGAFGLGYLINKLFSSDGFSKKGHRIEYVDL